MDQIRLPNISEDEQRILGLLLNQLAARQPRNLLRASYYDGKRAIRQVGSIIPPQYYRLGLVLGWSAKAVDILARRCNLDRFIWPEGDLDSIGYGETFTANQFRTQASSAMISSLIHGTSFLINTRGDESKGEPAGLIHVKDAMSATGQWNTRTHKLGNLLSVTGRDDEGRIDALALYLDGVTITAERVGAAWSVDRSEHPWGVPAEALPYKPRVGREMGQSRISRPVMSLHDQALRTVIRMEAHADVFSYPEFWMLGADESIFKNPDGSQKAVWQTMLGRIKAIPDDEDAKTPRADVKQFAAASPEPHIAMLKQQAMLFSGETSVPLTSLGISDMSNPTSADSFIASREDLIAEAEGATDDWTPALARTMTRALAMANGEDGVPSEWATIAPKFRSPVHLSRAAEADAGVKQVSAAPWLAETTVGLELLGMSDQQIERAMAEKRRNAGRAALAGLSLAAAAARPPEASESQ